uniref:Uncharacterized protein n=1 Tax=Isometrus maculatus TaxID=497827 RepID=A0A0U1S4N8_ISOMC|nr:hypothetical protein [Isometrus maculatus]
MKTLVALLFLALVVITLGGVVYPYSGYSYGVGGYPYGSSYYNSYLPSVYGGYYGHRYYY